MRCERREGRESRRYLFEPAMSIIILSLAIGFVQAGSAGIGPVTVTSGGAIQISGSVVVPPFPGPGGWNEIAGKTSARYETRHFLYRVPGEAPALELYLAADKEGGRPDGAFEMGLVQGFVRGFASKAGLRAEEPVFGDHTIGTARIKHTSMKLQDSQRALWMHAYIYVRSPSLTFIAIRTKDGGREVIERYLTELQIK